LGEDIGEWGVWLLEKESQRIFFGFVVPEHCHFWGIVGIEKLNKQINTYVEGCDARPFLSAVEIMRRETASAQKEVN
jgi:hypothetical protein